MEKIINGMDVYQWLPNYYLLNPPITCQNGFTYFILRSDSNKRLFIYSLYEALIHYMNYIGYDVYRNPKTGKLVIETFRYYYPIFKDEEFKNIGSRYFKRLNLTSYKCENNKSIYKRVFARFFDNDPSLNFGFSVAFGSRTVTLRLQPYILKAEGQDFDPCKFVKDFLIKISYPEHMYNYQSKHGYLSRLFFMYQPLIQKKGDYKEYNLPS